MRLLLSTLLLSDFTLYHLSFLQKFHTDKVYFAREFSLAYLYIKKQELHERIYPQLPLSAT